MGTRRRAGNPSQQATPNRNPNSRTSRGTLRAFSPESTLTFVQGVEESGFGIFMKDLSDKTISFKDKKGEEQVGRINWLITKNSVSIVYSPKDHPKLTEEFPTDESTLRANLASGNWTLIV